MGRVTLKGGTLTAPLPPVLVTCGTGEHANIITIAWTGILSTIPPKTYISVRPERHSYGLLKETKEFVIHLCPAHMAKMIDYCGTFTGKKVNKFEKCHFTKIESQVVSCPTIAECPIAIECKICDEIPLGSHEMLMADIVSMTVDESILDENGKIHYEKADLCAYAHGEYYALGKKIGKFGFSALKNRKKR